jgi:hypothetical protein
MKADEGSYQVSTHVKTTVDDYGCIRNGIFWVREGK